MSNKQKVWICESQQLKFTCTHHKQVHMIVNQCYSIKWAVRLGEMNITSIFVLWWHDTILYSSTSPACVFQGKVDSAATSVQLRSQIQVSVQLSVCQTPGGGDFLLCASAAGLIRAGGIALSWLFRAKLRQMTKSNISLTLIQRAGLDSDWFLTTKTRFSFDSAINYKQVP